MSRATNARRLAAALLGIVCVAAPVGAQSSLAGEGGYEDRHSDQDNCVRPGGQPYTRSDAPAIIYVDSRSTGAQTGRCWREAYRDLQRALDAARAGSDPCEIWVARGVYRPDRGGGARDLSFELVEGVAVYGGFTGIERRRNQRNADARTNGTFLSGDLRGDDAQGAYEDNSFTVVTAIGLSEATILDGFTITAGRATGTQHQRQGGGMHISAADVRVQGCVLQHNLAVEGGGAYVDSGSPLWSDCEFVDNRATLGGALHVTGSGAPRVEFSLFSRNSAAEEGGDLLADGDALPLLMHSRSWGASAARGAALAAAGASFVEAMNCIISGAKSEGAGGALLIGPQAAGRLVNCTLVENQAGAGAGIHARSGGFVRVENTILWMNADDTGASEKAQIHLIPGAAAAIQYSCISNWTGILGGAGNHGGEPRFARHDGTASADFRLLPGSACIDAGNTGVFDLALMEKGLGEEYQVDFDLQSRFADDPNTVDTGVSSYGLPVVDIGAFEFHSDRN